MKKIIFYFILCSNFIFAQTTITEFIKVDQFGYKPYDEKIAVITNPVTGYNNTATFSPGANYQVKSWVTNSVVFTSSLTAWNSGTTHAQSGDKVWWFNFSSFTSPGSYYIYDVTNNVKSYRFEIDSCIYNNVLKSAVRMLYYQRCGSSKSFPFIDTGYVDGVCHQGTQQDADCRLYSNTVISTSRNLSGGWHDAGDYNKYVNFSYSTLIDLLLGYEENPNVWKDDYNIPESGNGTPDVLDEAKYEIDWLVKMQGVDSSLLSVIGGGSGSPPSVDNTFRRYGPPTTASSLTGANIFALAAIQFSAIGQITYATNLKNRAIKAWQWAMNHPAITFSNSGVLAAGEQQISQYEIDMRKLTGAVYLYALTGLVSYKNYVDANINSIHLISWSYAYPFEGAEQDGVLYYTKIPGATASVKTQILNAYTQSMQTNNADNLPAYTNKTDAYRAYLSNSNYTWNSNQTKSKQGNMLLAMKVYNLNTANATNYINAASGYLHYFHGINPNTKVYLSNMKKLGAENYVKQFYNGWFLDGSALWDENGVSTYGPPPGYIPGGPNPGYALDACCPGGCGSAANNALCTTNVTPPQNQPIQKSYKDFNNDWPLNSWTITEAGIYTNAAYIRMVSKFCTSNCNAITTDIRKRNSNFGFSLYPNPTEDKLFVKILNIESTVNCSIFDVSGKEVYSNIFNCKQNNIIEINSQLFEKGIYIIQLKSNSGVQTSKFVKE